MKKLIDLFQNSLWLKKSEIFEQILQYILRACKYTWSKNLLKKIPKKMILAAKWSFERGLMIQLSVFIALIPGSVYAAKENLAMQELRLDLEEYGRSVHAHKVDIELLHEKVEGLQNTLSTLRDELKAGGDVDLEVTKERASQLEKKFTTLEKNCKTLSSDFILLKNHINETASTIAALDKKLETLEKDLSSDIKSLKNTMQTIVAYVEAGAHASPASSGLSSGKNYIVQAGDTLEKIATKHRTSIKELKEVNRLSTDRIYSGQKLQIP